MTMETKFIKVSVKDRLPNQSGDYITDGGTLTFHKRQWKSPVDNISHHSGFYHPTEGYFQPTYWIELIT